MKKGWQQYIKSFCSELKNNAKDLKSIKTIYKQIPNMLTAFRAIAPIPINILFFSGNIVGSLMFSGLAFLTDAFDGPVARKFKLQSQFGADLDAICDKLLFGGIALPIVIQNPIMILNVIIEGLIASTNVKAKLNGNKPKSSMTGKIKTWVLSLTVLSGYFTSLYNITISPLVSLLAITPALLLQLKTFINYYQINHKEETLDNNIEKQLKKADDPNLEKTRQLNKIYGPATLEELKELKVDLLKTNNELGYQKTNSLK